MAGNTSWSLNICLSILALANTQLPILYLFFFFFNHKFNRQVEKFDNTSSQNVYKYLLVCA